VQPIDSETHVRGLWRPDAEGIRRISSKFVRFFTKRAPDTNKRLLTVSPRTLRTFSRGHSVRPACLSAISDSLWFARLRTGHHLLRLNVSSELERLSLFSFYSPGKLLINEDKKKKETLARERNEREKRRS
jgi:hypothetical protein